MFCSERKGRKGREMPSFPLLEYTLMLEDWREWPRLFVSGVRGKEGPGGLLGTVFDCSLFCLPCAFAYCPAHKKVAGLLLDGRSSEHHHRHSP